MVMDVYFNIYTDSLIVKSPLRIFQQESDYITVKFIPW